MLKNISVTCYLVLWPSDLLMERSHFKLNIFPSEIDLLITKILHILKCTYGSTKNMQVFKYSIYKPCPQSPHVHNIFISNSFPESQRFCKSYALSSHAFKNWTQSTCTKHCIDVIFISISIFFLHDRKTIQKSIHKKKLAQRT